MNLLQYEKSPYLLQHKDNPVDWRPWGAEAFAAAASEDKPVFLSIGYSTCHWCHVMAHESFEDETAADVLNRNFISVKVDREERPDVDAVYMAACVAMNGSGGWPLTVILTPEQVPLWAGTYLPKANLLSLLAQVSQLWNHNRARLLSGGRELMEHLRREDSGRPGKPRRELIYAGTAAFSRSFDPQWGGFGRAPKFPSAHNLLFLLRYSALSGDVKALEMAESTLEHMYRGGIFDHVGGGFSRYSTDQRWLVPHFEKMLYDNALLALAYAEAYRLTGRKIERDIACRTLDYVLDELRDPAGGFYCGQDADSEGEEGKYYVFTKAEMEHLLGNDAAAICAYFGVTEAGNFENGKNILNLIDAPDWEHPFENSEEFLAKVRQYRKARTILGRDDKILSAWNGLMIAALARAGLLFDEPRYLQAARRAAVFLRDNLRDERGRLLARWRDGEAAHAGTLDDYAFLSWGLLELYGATFQTEWYQFACDTADAMLEYFFDEKNGGFYPYASDGEQLISRSKDAYDGAIPSGNSVAGLVLFRLGRLTGEQRWRDAAEKQFRYLAGVAGEHPAGHGFALLAMTEELWPSAELVVAAAEVPEELFEFLRENYAHNLSVLAKTNASSEALSKLVPYTSNYPIPKNGVKYYLCQRGACAAPVTSLDEVKALLYSKDNPHSNQTTTGDAG